MKVNIIILDKNKYEIAKTSIKNQNFKVIHGNLLEQKGVLVTAGNSFGFMDGGLDLEFIKKYGWSLQSQIQFQIKNRPLKELLIGENLMLKLADGNTLIYAPTMRVPSILGPENINVYLSFKGIMAECIKNNIKEINVPLLGEGVGRVPIDIIIRQMEQGYIDFIESKYPVNWWTSSIEHQLLYKEKKDIVDLQN